jgi:hypothetical protein
MEILPEELNDNATQELNNARIQLKQIVDEDIDSLTKLLANTKIGKLSLADFEDIPHTIRWAFPLREEQFTRSSEEIKFFLGQWSMSKDVLLFLVDRMIKILPNVIQQSNDYTRSSPQRCEKRRKVFIDLTRNYQKFIGFAVNIGDVIEEYNELFTFLSNKITDPKYSVKDHRERKISYIFISELLSAAEELLLRGNIGRFTPTPLIRSALEVLIFRTILSPEDSSAYQGRYRGRKIEVQRSLQLEDILNAAKKFNYKFSIGTDGVKRLYELRSISIHRAWRISHSSMWYALHVVNRIRSSGLITIEDAKLSKAFDNILDELVKEQKIKIIGDATTMRKKGILDKLKGAFTHLALYKKCY